MRNNTSQETHFRIDVVSYEFAGRRQPARHRMVYTLLKEELEKEGGIHALQLKTKTPVEWEKEAAKKEKEAAKEEKEAAKEGKEAGREEKVE